MYNDKLLELNNLSDDEIIELYQKVEEHIIYLSDNIITLEEESDLNE